MWTFIVSKLISSLGSSIYTFGISFYIISATSSATNFAMNLVCSILPRTLFAPIAGYMADTYNKKIIIVSAQILSVLSVSGLLLYSLIDGISLTAIFIIAFVIATILEATMDFKLYTKKKEEANKEKMLQSIKEGIRYLKKNELISPIVIIALFINFFFGAFQNIKQML